MEKLVDYLVENFTAKDLARRMIELADPAQRAALEKEMDDWNNRDKSEDTSH